MAIQASDCSPSFTAEVVGKVFAEQYYKILFSSPENTHKFYQDSSVIGRPGLDGKLTSVSTMEGINDEIMSFNYQNYRAKIVTIYAQESYMKGVVVGVTGLLTGKDDGETKEFTQTFFLAPKEKGFYVLNDLCYFKDVDKSSTPLTDHVVAEENVTAPLTQDSEVTHVPIDVTDNGQKTSNHSDNGGAVVEEVVVSDPRANLSHNDVPQKDSQKTSYSSRVAVTTPANAPAGVVVRVAPNTDQQLTAFPKPKAPAPPSNGASPRSLQLSNSAHGEVNGIYIGGLPSDISIERLLVAIQKFGPANRQNIQIRKYNDGFCCGFVDFESSKSAKSAVEARLIRIGGKDAYIDYKKSRSQAGDNRRGFSSGRSGLRNDNFRGREKSIDGRSRDRSDSRDQKKYGESRDHGRHVFGNRGRNGEGNQNGGAARVGRGTGVNC